MSKAEIAVTEDAVAPATWQRARYLIGTLPRPPETGILVLLPLLMAALNRSWLFHTPIMWVDPYFYTGYFLHWGDLIDSFGETYYGARVPWILLGWIAHSVASPEIASVLLRFVLSLGGLLSIYAVVQIVWQNRLAAFLTAVLLGTHTYFLWAVSWDYVDGAGVTATLATLAALAAAARSPGRGVAMVAAGAAGVTVVSVNVALVVLGPLLLTWYLVLNHSGNRMGLFQSAAFAMAGGALASCGYALASLIAGGSFWYLGPQIDAVGYVGTRSVTHFRWLGEASWLLYPGAATVAGTAWLALAVPLRRIRSTLGGPDILAVGLLLAAGVLFVLLQVRGYPFLREHYYADYLMPFAFVVFGAILAFHLRPVEGSRAFWIGAIALAIAVVPWAADAARPIAPCAPHCEMLADHWPWIALVIACLAIPAYAGTVRVLGAVAVLAVLNLGIADVRTFTFDPDLADINQDRFQLVYDADAAIARFNEDRNLYFWFDRSERYAGIYVGLASMNMWGRRTISIDFPATTHFASGQEAVFTPGQLIAIPSTDVAKVDAANRRLGGAEQHLDILETLRIARGEDSFFIHITEVAPGKLDIPDERYVQRVGVPLASATHVAGSVRNAENGALAITTPSQPWAYAASLPLPGEVLRAAGDSDAAIDITLRITGASAGVGLLLKSERDFADRREVMPGEAITVRLKTPSLSSSPEVIIQSWELGQSASVELLEVAVVLPASVRLPVTPIQVTLPLDALGSVSGAISPSPSGVFITTSPSPAAPAAELLLGGPELEPHADRPAVLEVEGKVLEGRVIVRVLDSAGRELARESFSGSAGPVLSLRIPRLGDAAKLVIQSTDSGILGIIDVTALRIRITPR